MAISPERKYVNWVREERVSTVTFACPPVNQLSQALKVEFTECLGELIDDASTKVIVVAGAGIRAFSAGADAKEFPMRMTPEGRETIKQWHDTLVRLEIMPKPTIAAINGWCLGGGLEFALACDIRIAASSAQLGFPEARMGACAGGGGTYRLVDIVGPAKAKELNFTANPISAHEACRISLVNVVVPGPDAVPAAKEMAAIIASRPAPALKAIKTLIDHGVTEKRVRQMAFSAEVRKELFKSDDIMEGNRAFVGKRPPVFKQ